MNNGLIRVGLLAYGAIGHEHNIATQNTAGLELMAVCDTNPERVAAALELAALDAELLAALDAELLAAEDAADDAAEEAAELAAADAADEAAADAACAAA